MRMNKRLLFGIISIALAAVIALIGIPAVIGQSNTKINIVRVKEAIEEGTVVTAEHLEMAEVSSHGLPANVATAFTQVVGTYALVDLVPGDYFLPTKVSTESPEKDTILKNSPVTKSPCPCRYSPLPECCPTNCAPTILCQSTVTRTVKW